MTSIYFVRHAQPDERWIDDRTRPLTSQGIRDCQEVINTLADIKADKVISSPYKRSFDTVAGYAKIKSIVITTDERLRERKRGIETTENLLEKRWNDFNFCEEGGENLGDVQKRNIEAVKEMLQQNNMKIVVGTHGTALSSIMNYYNPSYGCEWFKKIWYQMPYIIRFDFDGQTYKGSEELLGIERGY